MIGTNRTDMNPILTHLKEILAFNNSIGTVVILDDVENGTLITPIWNQLNENTRNGMNKHILIVTSQHEGLLDQEFPEIPFTKFECSWLEHIDSVTLFQKWSQISNVDDLIGNEHLKYFIEFCDGMPQCLILLGQLVSKSHPERWRVFFESLKAKKFNELSSRTANVAPDMKIRGLFDALDLRFDLMNSLEQRCLLDLDKVIWDRAWLLEMIGIGTQIPIDVVHENVVSFICGVSILSNSSSFLTADQFNTSLQIIKKFEEISILENGVFGTSFVKIHSNILKWIQYKQINESEEAKKKFNDLIAQTYLNTYCSLTFPSIPDFGSYWYERANFHFFQSNQNRFLGELFGRSFFAEVILVTSIIEALINFLYFLPESWIACYWFSSAPFYMGTIMISIYSWYKVLNYTSRFRNLVEFIWSQRLVGINVKTLSHFLVVVVSGIVVISLIASSEITSLWQILDLKGVWKDAGGLSPILSCYFPGASGFYGLIFGVVDFSWRFIFFAIGYATAFVVMKYYAHSMQNSKRHTFVFSTFMRSSLFVDIIWMWRAQYWSINYIFFTFLLVRLLFTIGTQNRKLNLAVNSVFILPPVIFYFGRVIWFNFWYDDESNIWERYGILQLFFMSWTSSISVMIIDSFHSILLGILCENVIFGKFPSDVAHPTKLVLFMYDISWFLKWIRFWPAWVIFACRLIRLTKMNSDFRNIFPPMFKSNTKRQNQSNLNPFLPIYNMEQPNTEQSTANNPNFLRRIIFPYDIAND